MKDVCIWNESAVAFDCAPVPIERAKLDGYFCLSPEDFAARVKPR